MEHRFEMKIQLGVIEHLGVNLYSNIPAVLSEVIANAWDADATRVTIDIDANAKSITVVDNGRGMTADELNEQYLVVGYSRRVFDETKTPKGRHVMGRKGIGKLSLFSIADRYEVLTAGRDEDLGAQAPLEVSGIQMDMGEIRKRIRRNDIHYNPVELDVQHQDTGLEDTGTIIKLEDVKVPLDGRSVAGLRQRVARRFSVINPEHEFEVVIDGVAVSIEDRRLLKKARCLFTLGEGKWTEGIRSSYEDKAEYFEAIGTQVAEWPRDQNLEGWIGIVSTRGELADDENKLPIIAWGKLIHEDIISNLDLGGFWLKYVVGEIRADFIDNDKDPDIATSDRQSLREDDPRYLQLREAMLEVMRQVERGYKTWQRKRQVSAVAEGSPAVASALESLSAARWQNASPVLEGAVDAVNSGQISRESLGTIAAAVATAWSQKSAASESLLGGVQLLFDGLDIVDRTAGEIDWSTDIEWPERIVTPPSDADELLRRTALANNALIGA